MNMEPPQFPLGQFAPVGNISADDRNAWISDISQLPLQLRGAVDGLSDSQLNTKYRNWTVRQIVHHIADSHVNSYVRFKWTLTKDRPTSRPTMKGSGRTSVNRKRAV